MSLDACYIFSYDCLPYCNPTPMDIDEKFLQDKYGGYFLSFDNGCSLYWDKPKYTLEEEDLSNLLADRVLEKKDCQQWEIIK